MAGGTVAWHPGALFAENPAISLLIAEGCMNESLLSSRFFTFVFYVFCPIRWGLDLRQLSDGLAIIIRNGNFFRPGNAHDTQTYPAQGI